jgi:hypothetical protein
MARECTTTPRMPGSMITELAARTGGGEYSKGRRTVEIVLLLNAHDSQVYRVRASGPFMVIRGTEARPEHPSYCLAKRR